VAKQATELRYAVRFRVVFKYFGQLCLVLTALTMVPLVMSLIFGERHFTLRYAVVVCGLAGLGLGTGRLRAPSSVQPNEGMVLVALMFLFTPLAMCYPMMSSGLSFLDALFEAVSGVTTTGLSTKATLVGTPATFLFARAWMQWYGGLGIVVLSLALVMQPGLVASSVACRWESGFSTRCCIPLGRSRPGALPRMTAASRRSVGPHRRGLPCSASPVRSR
jgi:trk system potassium uptake protein TrkH